jgi:hypothetical protein
MADVVVTLSLTRKSGILAAAVSSLARNGLEFKSHRFVDADDAGGLLVELMAEGEVEDKDGLTEVLERIRGVDAVTDIGVDGRSLLHDQPVEDEGAGTGSESQLEPEPEPERIEVAEPVEEAPAAMAPEPEPAASLEFSEASEQDDGAGVDADESRPERADSSGKNPMRRSMMRRRRRFT